MAEHRVDGSILLPASHSTADDLRGSLDQTRLPHVLVCRAVPGYASNYVGADNQASGELAGRHLREIGAHSVAFIGGVEHSVPREDRRRGLLTGLGPDVRRLTADLPSPDDSTADLAPLLSEALADGVPDAVRSYPTLTSANGFPDRVGALATELLVSSIKSSPADPEQVLVPPTLSVRQTTLSWAGGHGDGKKERSKPSGQALEPPLSHHRSTLR